MVIILYSCEVEKEKLQRWEVHRRVIFFVNGVKVDIVMFKAKMRLNKILAGGYYDLY